MSGQGGVAMAESHLSCSHQTGNKWGFINTLTYNFPFFLFKVGKFHTFWQPCAKSVFTNSLMNLLCNIKMQMQMDFVITWKYASW